MGAQYSCGGFADSIYLTDSLVFRDLHADQLNTKKFTYVLSRQLAYKRVMRNSLSFAQ